MEEYPTDYEYWEGVVEKELIKYQDMVSKCPYMKRKPSYLNISNKIQYYLKMSTNYKINKCWATYKGMAISVIDTDKIILEVK